MVERSQALITDIQCAADLIRSSHKGVVLTGAGISTASGIPDFRSSEGGLWTKVDPFEVASLSAFRYAPERFFRWIQPMAHTIFAAQPNAAHIGLARLQQAGYFQTLITQNIDTLHQKAGSNNVLEVHGTWETMTCIRCYAQYESKPFMPSFLEQGEMPHCPECSGILKPDLVLFGEQLPVRTWLMAQKASKECDLMLVAGSSLEVLPVAGLPMRAIENGAHLILINHTPTYIDVRADLVFHAAVEEIIPRIVEAVLNQRD